VTRAGSRLPTLHDLVPPPLDATPMMLDVGMVAADDHITYDRLRAIWRAMYISGTTWPR